MGSKKVVESDLEKWDMRLKREFSSLKYPPQPNYQQQYHWAISGSCPSIFIAHLRLEIMALSGKFESVAGTPTLVPTPPPPRSHDRAAASGAAIIELVTEVLN